jgi:DHA1 family bicyclomycin/chloramphenicol resistance-like MFS transporter
MHEPSRSFLFALLIAMSAITMLGMHILLPSLPTLQTAFGADYATVQQALTFYLLALAFGQLVHGPLSDQFGRRPVILWGMFVFFLGSLMCLFAPTIHVLIAGRVLQAAGGCAGLTLGRAIVRDLYAREQAASMIAYITMAMVTAPMVAPLIGGYLDVWLGWRSIFIFTAMIGFVVWLALLLRLPETNASIGHEMHLREMLKSFAYLLKRRDFLTYSLMLGFMSGAFFAFLGAGPYVVMTLMDRTPADYGLYFLIAAVAFMFGNMLAGRISTRVGIDRMILMGWSLSIVGATIQAAFVYAGTLTPLTFFAPMILMSVGQGFNLPNATAGAVSADPTRAGAASGLAGFIQMGIGAGSSYVAGALVADTAIPVVTTITGLVAIAGIILFLGHRRRSS